MEIVKRLYWDNTLHMSEPMHVLTELYLWLRNIKSHNSKSHSKPIKKNVIIFSDATEVGAGAYSVEVNSKVFSPKLVSIRIKHEINMERNESHRIGSCVI